MTQAAKAQEPSMEEILASIRRIIADDDGGRPQAKAPTSKPADPVPVKAAPPPPPPPAPVQSAPVGQDDIDAMLASLDNKTEEADDAPVLDLTEAMTASPAEPTKPSFRKIDARQDVVFNEPVAMAPLPPRAEEPPPSALLSETTRAAVNSAFGSLAHTVLVQNARTLEDLVKEMLRPMLKAWLDQNLPGIVERLVRTEIERVARGQQS